MRTLVVALAVSAALPAAAPAAQAPLRAPDAKGVTHALSNAHISFSLPADWTPSHSVMANNLIHGTYDRTVALPGTLACGLQVSGGGQLQAAKPDLRHAEKHSGSPKFVITQRGHVGALRWYAGRSDVERLAYAWRPAPAGLAAPRLRYLVVQIRLSAVGRPAAECAAPIAHERASLVAAIRSAHAVSKRSASARRLARSASGRRTVKA